jgi:pSer/pThr/pTyr-binding forkhead associated (FHA) protein
MWLSVISGPQAGRAVEVLGELTIGRGAECALRLPDPKVSRRHATLASAQHGIQVHDDDSLNGTWVNDRRITGLASLSAGDRLRIGGSEFVVVEHQDDEVEETVGVGLAELDALIAGPRTQRVVTGDAEGPAR